MVVAYRKQGKCLHWFLGAVGFNRYFHARQAAYSENLFNTDFQSALVAENTRISGDGSVSGLRP